MEHRITIGGVVFFAVVGVGPAASADPSPQAEGRAPPPAVASAPPPAVASAPPPAVASAPPPAVASAPPPAVASAPPPAVASAPPPAVASAPPPAAAPRQPSAAELASARRLFALGLAAEDQGRWAEALETYERIRKIVVSPSLWYHLGACHEALGHVVEALNAFELALSSATARRELALARESRSRIEKLRVRTSQIVLRLPEDAAGVHVEIDGEPINPALVGAAILVTPGERRVVVRAENYEARFEAAVQAETGAVVELRAELGPRRPVASARPLAPARPAPLRAPAPGPRISPVAVVGAAAALAAGAVVTGVIAYDVRQTFLKRNANPAPGSLDERQALRDRGQALAITSTVLTGAALVAGGFATYLFWPSSSPRAAPADVAGTQARPARAPGPTALSPWIGLDGAGVAVRGAL
ncbi:tetratricopeptide repeat protein [Sorangium sp. So ce269]